MEYAVGLDGQRIRLERRRDTRVLAPSARGDASGMAEFDRLPRYARDALQGESLSFKIKTSEIAPYIHAGMIGPSTIRMQLTENDKRLRREMG